MQKLIASELASDPFGAAKIRNLDGITTCPGLNPAGTDDARGTTQECLLREVKRRGCRQIPEKGSGLGSERCEDDAFGSGGQAIKRR